MIPFLQHQPDPPLRTLIIHRAGPEEIDPSLLYGQLKTPFDNHLLIASLLALGEYHSLLRSWRMTLREPLTGLFLEAPYPGVHSVVEWLLQRWDFGSALEQAR